MARLRAPEPLDVDRLLPHQLVPFFLMASWLYYHLDVSAIADAEYDALARRLKREWNAVRHQHKRLIRPADLDAGTGYAIRTPTIARSAAVAWARQRGVLK